MNIIYDEYLESVDTYKYTVNQGGKLNIKVSNGSDRYVEIVFVDGKFDHVSHNMSDHCERSKWHIFEAINKKIKELENRYKEGES